MINSRDTEHSLPSCRNSGCSDNSEFGLRAASRRGLVKAQSLGAAVGLLGGVLTALLGALLTVAGWIVANEGVRHWFSTAGAILFSLTIPLLIFSGYCLDWMEKDKPQRHYKVARYENDDEEQ
jgi:hypothetical protein